MNACTVTDCQRAADRYPSLGLCNAHALRLWRYGSPTATKPKAPPEPCPAEGCDRLARRDSGLCRRHCDLLRRNGDPTIVRKGGVPKGTPQEGRPPKGGLPGYDAAHRRIARSLGPASAHACLECAGRAAEWAYLGGDPDELTTRPDLRREHPGLAYSLKPEHYGPLCKPCHRRRDRSLERGRDAVTGRWTA
jgi:hypothetical protein